MKRFLPGWFVAALLACLVGACFPGSDVLGAPARQGEPATADRINFTVFLTPPVDPFSDMNQRGMPPGAPLILGGAATVGWVAGPSQEAALVAATAVATQTTPTFRRGETFTLHIVGVPRPGFYTYPLTQRADPDQKESGLNKLTFLDTPGLKPLPPVLETAPQFTVVKELREVYLEHKHPFEWSQDILVLPSATPGPVVLSFQLGMQVCNDKTCVQGIHTFQVPLWVSGQPPLPETPELQARLKAPPLAIDAVPVPEALRAQAKAAKPTAPAEEKPGENQAAVPPAPTQDLTQRTLAGQLFLAVGGAVAMLFTPCVFPMIPVTISFFLKQAEKTRQNPLALALVYAGTIVVVLTLAVLLLGSIILGLANNAWLNLGFGALLLFFALSLFGMYEIELPSFLSNYTLAHQDQGGLVGAVFMALTFTITSFTCTGPFLGVILTPVAATQLGWPTLMLLSLAYAVTFASPFFLLALFPGLLKSLPKSGTWLNAVKVVMGFIEVAAAFKFLSIADSVLSPGNPRWFTYDTVLCSWIALSVACGLYLLGVFRLPNDTPSDHVGVPRLLLATLFFGLAIHMTPNLWHANSAGTGVVGEFLSSMLPAPSRAAAPHGNGSSPSWGSEPEPYWHQDYEKAWKEAVAQDKLLFIDFTGVNCQNCRLNENNVFTLPNVRKELANYVRVQVYNDIVPDPALSASESKRLAARNLDWQKDTFGDVSTPLYVVLRPDRKTMEADGKLQGVVLSRYAGVISDPSVFIDQVLKAPFNKQRAEAK